jgi:hypothetical protein
MSERDWPAVWRDWLRARFGERLDAAALDAAVEACEQLRAVWEPLLSVAPDNGELPFPNALPARDEPGGSGGREER